MFDEYSLAVMDSDQANEPDGSAKGLVIALFGGIAVWVVIFLLVI